MIVRAMNGLFGHVQKPGLLQMLSQGMTGQIIKIAAIRVPTTLCIVDDLITNIRLWFGFEFFYEQIFAFAVIQINRHNLNLWRRRRSSTHCC